MTRPATSSSVWRLDLGLALLLVALTTWMWLSSYTLGYVNGNDSYDYAQMGRELATGNGFATRQIFPRHVPFYAEHGYLKSDIWPNLHRYPLPTIVDAVGYRLTGDPLTGAIAMCGMAYILSVVALYGFARRFTAPGLAFGLALLFASDPPVRVSSYNGYTEALAILLMLSALFLVFRRELRARECVGAGVLCGLAILNRYQAALLVPLLMGFLYFRSGSPAEGLKRTAMLAVCAVLVLVPWAVRDLIVVGQPLFSLSSTRSLLKGFGWDADMMLNVPVDLPSVLSQYGDQILGKCTRCLHLKATSIARWTKMMQGPAYVGVLGVSLASLLWSRGARGDFELLKRGVLLFVLANILLQCVSVDHPRLYVPLRPLLLVVAVLGVLQGLARVLAADRMPFSRGVAAVSITLLAAWQATAAPIAILPPDWGNQQAASIAESVRSWCPYLEPDAVVASDVSLRITIYCGNRTIRLPSRPPDLMAIDRRYEAVDYVLLSPVAASGVTKPGRRAPNAYLETGFFDGRPFQRRFEHIEDFPSRGRLYRRRARSR